MFVFKGYIFDHLAQSAHFRYENNGIEFEEAITFGSAKQNYDEEALDRALFLAFILIGTSYYKTFPSREVSLIGDGLDDWQVAFFNSVYQEGMSQFAFENQLTRKDLAHFKAEGAVPEPAKYYASDREPLVLQSGGKDSLLLAVLLQNNRKAYTPWFLQNTKHHPLVLDSLRHDLVVADRSIDKQNLEVAERHGGKNGHVPVTYIVLSAALIQAILLGKDTVLAAVGNEGEEPHELIGDLEVRHQWSKTWKAEQAFVEYVKKYVSPDIKIGSALRQFSELKIAKLFVENAWEQYSREFSSCNIANYMQGTNNQRLQWCGNCPKCANSFLLFAPFVEPQELIEVFNGENLFKKESLIEIYKGLLGVEGVMKPFECVGEIDELRKAYHLARKKSDEFKLPFSVPESDFDIEQEYPSQPWVSKLI